MNRITVVQECDATEAK